MPIRICPTERMYPLERVMRRSLTPSAAGRGEQAAVLLDELLRLLQSERRVTERRGVVRLHPAQRELEALLLPLEAGDQHLVRLRQLVVAWFDVPGLLEQLGVLRDDLDKHLTHLLRTGVALALHRGEPLLEHVRPLLERRERRLVRLDRVHPGVVGPRGTSGRAAHDEGERG